MIDYNTLASNFQVDGTFIYGEPFGCGHINDTYALYFKREFEHPLRYILQRINHQIFQNVDQLMQNITGVTDFIAKKVEQEGGDVSREVLQIVKTKTGAPYYRDAEGNYFRMYVFVDDTICLQTITEPEHFYQSAKAFGKFQKQLNDFPAETLFETIPNFHNTRDRYRLFTEAVSRDLAGRAASVAAEIDFIRQREKDTGVLLDLLAEKKIPLRVTHNDTKLNNVLLDLQTGKGICVIDLDTVMPGLAHYDFGDSIRFGASTAAEDETDLSKVSMSLELFDLFSKGFLEECGDSLTETELEYLPFGAKLMTFECGMRFLTDYLNGDTYFKIHRPNHNLDRCRTQLRLVEDMENKQEEMLRIVRKYRQ